MPPAVLATMAAALVAASGQTPVASLAALPRRASASEGPKARDGQRAPGLGCGGAAAAEARGRKASIPMRDGSEIEARIYEPSGGAAAAVIVYAHGGAFSAGDCESNAEMARALCAAAGSVVVDTSYRQGAAHPHPAAVEDLEDVTRAARGLYPGLPLGVAGSSSGGFFALALSQRPPDGLSYDFCIALAPVADPGKRRDYLRHCVNGTAAEAGFKVYHTASVARAILQMQNGYWVTDAAADAAGASLGPGKGATPTFVVLGGQDLNVPPQVTQSLHYWVDRIIVLGKHGHELCDRAPANEDQ